MKGRNRTLLILFLIFAGLAFYTYFGEIKGGAKREKAKEQATKILSLTPDDVKEITLKVKGKEFHLQRKDEKNWELTSPIVAKADRFVADGILSNLADLKSERTISEQEEKPEIYGLKEAEISIRLKTKNGQESGLTVGDSNPIGDSVFVQPLGTKKVLLTGAFIKNYLNKNLSSLREKQLFSFDRDLTSEIHIRLSQQEPILIKRNEGAWWLETAKPRTKAESQKVEDLIASLSNLTVRKFEQEVEADSKPQPNSFSQEVVVKDKEKKTQLHLLIGEKAKEGIFVKKKEGSEVYVVAQHFLESLPHKNADIAIKLEKKEEKKATTQKEEKKKVGN